MASETAYVPIGAGEVARARGLEVAEDDAVLAARLASVVVDDGTPRLVQRFVRGREDACRALAQEIAAHEVDGLRFRYAYSGHGDGTLIIGGGGSHEVTDSDPLALDLPVLRAQARADASDGSLAARTAEALNGYLRWAHVRLAEHVQSRGDGEPPINFLITKWAGPKAHYEPFAARWGMRAASLPDEEVVTGLLLEMGFHIERVEGESPELDLRRRLERAGELFREGYEFVHLHTKYPDPMSHDNEPARCVEAIEQLDAAMEYYWETLANDGDIVTVLTTDHSTPSVWHGWPRGKFNDQHGGEPGPITIRGGNVRVDGVSEAGERPAAAAGGLGLVRGEDFMPVLLNAAERANLWEMRPTPERRPYRPRPEELEPFQLSER